jgi:transposase-like protein
MGGMNKLSNAERARVVAALVEGNSIRATVRMTGAAKNTWSSSWRTWAGPASGSWTSACVA